MADNEKNLKEEMWDLFTKERNEAIRAVMPALRNMGKTELHYTLTQIYDLGYDHGTTFLAEFPED